MSLASPPPSRIKYFCLIERLGGHMADREASSASRDLARHCLYSGEQYTCLGIGRSPGSWGSRWHIEIVKAA
eukprot:6497438-Pyramimonas_sp.AAC.1